MKMLMCIAALLITTGCGTYWIDERMPLTEVERKAIDEHVKATLCATKRDLTISGKDQDWDDYARAVYNGARLSLCKPRLVEYRRISDTPTGRIRDFVEAK